MPDPNFEDGINYWNDQPASIDGVLGGFGKGTLPRVDALGSRQFIQYLLPSLSTVPSAARPLQPASSTITFRTRALDVGAGVGRTTQSVLLHLFDDVVLVEPVEKFIKTAYKYCRESQTSPKNLRFSEEWRGMSDSTKSVTFIQSGLQNFDPMQIEGNTSCIGRVGYQGGTSAVYDVIWCQWCLGHLSNEDLIKFFGRAKAALRSPSEGLIVVKENLCDDLEGGGPRIVFDETDSSVTRSDAAWLKLFEDAGLTVIRKQTQEGLLKGLYEVKM
ncbi:DUF858-domain-containing protein [Hysterangium stoloniferum]|nr:DUF858-domain-containing protein [Hysterangium stoloniferum]